MKNYRLWALSKSNGISAGLLKENCCVRSIKKSLKRSLGMWRVTIVLIVGICRSRTRPCCIIFMSLWTSSHKLNSVSLQHVLALIFFFFAAFANNFSSLWVNNFTWNLFLSILYFSCTKVHKICNNKWKRNSQNDDECALACSGSIKIIIWLRDALQKKL